jgi:hypothetical protein
MKVAYAFFHFFYLIVVVWLPKTPRIPAFTLPPERTSLGTKKGRKGKREGGVGGILPSIYSNVDVYTD